MLNNFINIQPVLPSQHIERDIIWYEKHTGFKAIYFDNMYAILKCENIYFHLQWHADNENDPLLGGSVLKIFVRDIHSIFEEFITKKTVTKDQLILNTPWRTNEFGIYDLNNNAIFFVENLSPNS